MYCIISLSPSPIIDDLRFLFHGGCEILRDGEKNSPCTTLLESEVYEGCSEIINCFLF